MANLPEDSSTWEDGIYQLEYDDFVEGGADGTSNKQAKQLANRTAYLKYHNDANEHNIDRAINLVYELSKYIDKKYKEAVAYTDTQIESLREELTKTAE